MPDSMSVERQLLMQSYGAEVVLTPGKEGMIAAIAKAEALAKEIPGSFIPGQFENPQVQIVAVESAESPLLSQGRAGSYGLQGIGANFIPIVLQQDIIDQIITVTEDEAYAAGRLLAKTEGILVGISSGAALHAALLLAKDPCNAGKTIVALLPDTGERYLSTPMFQQNNNMPGASAPGMFISLQFFEYLRQGRSAFLQYFRSHAPQNGYFPPW